MSDELANTGKILIYQTEKGDTKVDVYFAEDTIWMTQRAMCELYQVAKSSISEHIKHIYSDGELIESATVRNFRTVQTEGGREVNRDLEYRCYSESVSRPRECGPFRACCIAGRDQGK